MFLTLDFGFFSRKTEQKPQLFIFKRPGDPLGNPYKYYLKKSFNWFKIAFYSFSGLMIAWSFFQSMFTSYVRHNNNPGEGLEAGYPAAGTGSTGDYRYDAFPWTPNPWAHWPLISSGNGFGPFIQWFVYPFSRVFLALIWAFKGGTGVNSHPLDYSGFNVIFAILIVLLFMKLISFPFIFRAQYYSDKQQRHKRNIALINSKYEFGNDASQDWKQLTVLRQRELSRYNKKHNLKPMAPIENIFIITPIFLVVYRLMTITRPVKYAKLFGKMLLSKAPYQMILSSEFIDTGWMYLLFCSVLIPVIFFNQKFPTILMKKRFPDYSADSNLSFRNVQLGNTKKIHNIMTLVFLLFAFFWSTSLAIYYFFNAILNILSNYIIHIIIKGQKGRESALSRKLKKLGL